MTMAMKISRAKIAEKKVEMLEVWLVNPNISNAEMAKRFNCDDHTVAKYKQQWIEIFDRWQLNVEKKIEQDVKAKVGIWEGLWQTITGKK